MLETRLATARVGGGGMNSISEEEHAETVRQRDRLKVRQRGRGPLTGGLGAGPCGPCACKPPMCRC